MAQVCNTPAPAIMVQQSDAPLPAMKVKQRYAPAPAMVVQQSDALAPAMVLQQSGAPAPAPAMKDSTTTTPYAPLSGAPGARSGPWPDATSPGTSPSDAMRRPRLRLAPALDENGGSSTSGPYTASLRARVGLLVPADMVQGRGEGERRGVQYLPGALVPRLSGWGGAHDLHWRHRSLLCSDQPQRLSKRNRTTTLQLRPCGCGGCC